MHIIKIREVETPAFGKNRHMLVVILSHLRTGRLYPQEILMQLEGRSTPRSQCGQKYYVNGTIGNRTRDIPFIIQYLKQLRHRIQQPENNEYVIAIRGRDNFLILSISTPPVHLPCSLSQVTCTPLQFQMLSAQVFPF